MLTTLGVPINLPPLPHFGWPFASPPQARPLGCITPIQAYKFPFSCHRMHPCALATVLHWQHREAGSTTMRWRFGHRATSHILGCASFSILRCCPRSSYPTDRLSGYGEGRARAYEGRRNVEKTIEADKNCSDLVILFICNTFAEGESA